ncbi:MAG: cell division protein FtsZ [Desulfobulbaceae bacterium]|nr:cell division protein FtsZ [Desulfobulbaceae bacterium]
MTFEIAELDTRAKLAVIGVGGGGGNAVNTMVESQLGGVNFIAANTDVHALESSKADIRLQLGPKRTKGLGAGANPEVGRESAEESIQELREALTGSDMVFVTAGMGGGTGTGAAPVVARIARELGALTVGVVTKPFVFEGRSRMKNAELGWAKLKEHVDTIITIPNDRLLALSNKGTTFINGMKMADDVLVQAVKGISDLINLPGYINPDFADVRAIMSEMGQALMGAGECIGEKRAVDAVNMAISSPLLQDISISGAKGVLVNISATQATLTMAEVNEATSRIYEEADDEAKIILGVMFDETLGEAMRVTVIATGIREEVALESLPSNVKSLVGKKEVAQEALVAQAPTQAPPQAQHGGHNSLLSRHGGSTFGSTNNHLQNTKPRPTSNAPRTHFLDEDELDRPTFIRRNEN